MSNSSNVADFEDSWAHSTELVNISQLLEFQAARNVLTHTGFHMDATFLTVMKFKQYMSCFLSAYCILGNAQLLAFLLTSEELRSWQLYPVMLQAFTDILGGGIGNFIYEHRFFSNLVSFRDQTYSYIATYIVPVRKLYQALVSVTAEDCLLTYLRIPLNEYSTGLCVVTTSVYRYVLVCHPHAQWENTRYRKIGITITFLILLTLCLSVVDLLFNSTYLTLSNQKFAEQKKFF